MGDHEKDKKKDKKKEKHHHHHEKEEEEDGDDSPTEEKPKKKKSKGSISLVVSTPEGEEEDAKDDGDGGKEKKKKKEKHHHHHHNNETEEGGEGEDAHKKEKKEKKKKKEEKEDEEEGEEKEGEKDGEKDKAGLLEKIEKRKKDRERRANTLRFRRSFGKSGGTGTSMAHKKSRSHVQPREGYSADDMETAKKRHSSLETVSNGPRPAISLDNGLRVVEENKPDKLSRWASLKGIRDGFLRSQNEEARRNRSFSGSSLALEGDLESIANPLLALQQKQHLAEQKKEREILSESPSLDERTRMRHKVINEIINTERDYINDLTRVIKLFLEPLARDGILTTEEIKDIFSNVKLLVNVNNALLDDLWKQAKETNGEQLGQSFVLLSHYLKMYSQYCGNQKVSREAIAACLKSNSRFKAFLEKQATLPELNNLSLKDFLIKPVQRLCKYPLLLRELLKYTDESHPDHEKLKAAFEAIQEAVESVNAQKQTEEEMEEVAEMLNTLTGTEKFGVQLMVPGRKFVKEGTVKTAPKDHSSSTLSHYFMFSDLLILAEEHGSAVEGKKKGKKGSNKREVLGMLPFAMCLLNFAPDDEANGLKHVVEIIQSTSIFTFHFDSSTEKEEWIKLLKIENMNDDEEEEKTKD